MRIIRHKDEAGQICYSAQQNDGVALRIIGDIFGEYEVTNTASKVAKVLAPGGTNSNLVHRAEL